MASDSGSTLCFLVFSTKGSVVTHKNFVIKVHASVLLEKRFVPFDGGFTSEDGFGVGLMEDGISIIPSFTDMSLTPSSFGCALEDGVESVRRFPISTDGFVIKIVDSPTSGI